MKKGCSLIAGASGPCMLCVKAGAECIPIGTAIGASLFFFSSFGLTFSQPRGLHCLLLLARFACSGPHVLSCLPLHLYLLTHLLTFHLPRGCPSAISFSGSSLCLYTVLPMSLFAFFMTGTPSSSLRRWTICLPILCSLWPP